MAFDPEQEPADPSESLIAVPGPEAVATTTIVPFEPVSIARHRVWFSATTAGRTVAPPFVRL
jgi:hypothetical protein